MVEASDWVPVGLRSARKIKLYDLKLYETINFCSVTVAVAPFGGNIAIANNFDESNAKRRQFTIVFYTPSGQLVGKSAWKNGDLLHMDWTCSEELVCVQSDGRVFVYNLFGQEQESRRFSMGQEAQGVGLVECQLFDSYNGTGIAVLTAQNRFYLVNNVNDPKLWRAAERTDVASARPSCWTVISNERQTKVLSVYNSSIYFLEAGHGAEQIIPAFAMAAKHYSSVSLSPDKESLAFLTENGVVQIGSSDLQMSVCECDSGHRSAGSGRFVWCGNSAVAVLLDKSYITLVGLDGDNVSFVFDSSIAVCTEVDGLRVASAHAYEYLTIVPKVTQNIYSVGSMSSSALLYAASKEYKNKNYNSYDYLHMIEPNLPEAVEECVEAAAHEYDSENQRLLLEAAAFGKAYCPNMNSENFVRICRQLRVLNSLRDSVLAMPLTYEQFTTLTEPVVIDRLIARHQLPTAINACTWLRIDPGKGVERVAAQWALKKIQMSSRAAMPPSVDEDRVLAKQICEKFSQFSRISYADTAEKAAEFGRKELATLLLENEPNIERQVFMLIKLDRNEKALSKATESGDPDLIFAVFLHLKRKLVKKGDLELILRNFPVAFALYKKYCEIENPQLARALHSQFDDFYAQAMFCLKEAGDTTVFDVKEKLDNLKEAEQCFRKAHDDFAYAQVTDHGKLLNYQAKFEEQFGHSFTDRSLRDTFIWLVAHSENAKAEVLRKEFKLSDKQYYFWKIEALANSDQWSELETFGKAKKPPIGYLPFVEICMTKNQVEEAKKYLGKLTAEDKVKGLIKMNLLMDAATLAFEQKDPYGLEFVLKRCGPQHRGLSEHINKLKESLSQSSKKK